MLMTMMLTLMALSGTPNPTCLTPQLLPLPRHRVPHSIVTVWSSDKIERDSFGVFPNEVRSDNFVIKWGDGRVISPTQSQRLLDAFEQGWQTEVVVMGHPQPIGTDSDLFNVYIGDTGSGTPSSHGSGGYFSLDDEGWPMIVLNPDILADGYGAETTAVHEFYHSIQYSTGSFAGYDEYGAWFWEATATWMEGEVYPDDPNTAKFIGGFGFKPQYAVDFFDYPDTGAFLELHQYGAFIFARYLSEIVADYTLIRDVWVEAADEPDPLVVLRGVLGSHGTTLEVELGRFAAHNATWDYANAATYREYLQLYAQQYSEYDDEVAALHVGVAGDDWHTPPAVTLPQRYGYNTITLEGPTMKHLAAAFEGDATGTHGTASRYAVTVVREHQTGVEYVELPLEGTSGEVVVSGVDQDHAVHLVVAATADIRRVGETFGYRYRLAPALAPTPQAPTHMLSSQSDGEGGCAAVPNNSNLVMWAGLVLLGIGCRRRTQCGAATKNICTLICVMVVLGCGDDPVSRPKGLPDALPFVFERPSQGEPLSDEEVTAWTRELMDFLVEIQFFDWALWTSHGVDESTGMRDYAIRWQDVQARRDGDIVTFVHDASATDYGAHNAMIPTAKVLTSALAGHLLTGDVTMARVAEQYCKGVSATMLGMVYDANDPIRHLMARNLVTSNHAYVTHDDRKKAIDYSGWYSPYDRTNSSRFEYPNNPFWGSVWVTNVRSKDDVPHIYRAMGLMRYALADSNNDAVREACGQAYESLVLFSRDIVQSGYYIRSKDAQGVPFLPGKPGEPGSDLLHPDLSSFVTWESLFPGGECNAMNSAALSGFGVSRGNDCADGGPGPYDNMAIATNYFNAAIIRTFHISHLFHALLNHQFDSAERLLHGMVKRFEADMNVDESDITPSKDEWNRDLATSLLGAAVTGYPLNWEEARLIQRDYARAIREMRNWPNWDLWDSSSIPGGVLLPYEPPSSGVSAEGKTEYWTQVRDIAKIFEYCWSPLRNPSGAQLADCEVVADSSLWNL